ncbi:hypothetical protein, partial [Microbacterium sp. BF1]|uniref:hypothetical protein n=1 Tax=Microbacterium sp. BF1 TaxID=2821146 RepID=UPI001C4E290E
MTLIAGPEVSPARAASPWTASMRDSEMSIRSAVTTVASGATGVSSANGESLAEGAGDGVSLGRGASVPTMSRGGTVGVALGDPLGAGC